MNKMNNTIATEQTILDVTTIKIDFVPILYIAANIKSNWSED